MNFVFCFVIMIVLDTIWYLFMILYKFISLYEQQVHLHTS